MVERNPDVDAAVEAELTLLQPEVRRDRAAVNRMLAPRFTEVGRSGKLWTRKEMLDGIAGFSSSMDDGALVSEMTGRMILPGLVLITYVSQAGDQKVRRSSWWRRYEDGWRIEFHQGTPLG